ncbi:transporter substrate-binding domain-containing protein [Luteococcus sp.]|uniref:transporter substrate-binding domain-containing protein n=1 Tax=Luteococcus sp. TaxID=1969402 RepID=UPI002649F9BC|nr:transporter substrate-binding domain-containing protein [Luteococcus sp.]
MSTPVPPTNDPQNREIDDVVNTHSRRRPGWVIPAAVLAALALLAALLFGLTGRSKTTDVDAAAPASTGPDAQAAAGTARTRDQIKADGTIKIGVFSDKAPFGSVDANGTYVGYDIVYAERIAKDLGVKLELVPVEAASRVEFLTSAKVDAILANFTVTPERAAKVDFAKPYMKVSLGAVSPTGAKITDIKQLQGKKTIVVKGTTAETYLTKEHPELELLSFEQYTEATNALLDGRGAAWVTDNTEALAFSLQNDGKFTTGITTLGPTDTIAAAVQKGNTSLHTWLDEELVTLGKENFFHTAFDKTLKPAYGDAAKADDLVVEGGKA